MYLNNKKHVVLSLVKTKQAHLNLKQGTRKYTYLINQRARGERERERERGERERERERGERK